MVHGQPNENLVRDLCEGSQYLNILDRSFGYHMNLRGMGTNIISFYETDETPSVKEVRPGKWMRSGPCVRMVTEESVKHAAGGGQDFPMDANHSSIVKFKDRSDQKYQLVCSKLLGIARQLLIAPAETQVPCKERTKVCEWLYPGVVDNKHKEISSKRQEGTGGWLLADDRFISWKGGSGPRLLWGCGIPGAGKTFLSSLVIDVLDASSRGCSSTGLAYIYFDYENQTQQPAVALLRSLIKQLVTKPRALNFPIPSAVNSLYDDNCAAGTTPKLKALQDALAASLALFTESFFVFDALDECQEDIRKELLPLMHWFAGSGGRVFLTSRPHPQDIAISLTPTTHLKADVQRMDLEAKEEDVITYIEGTIQRDTNARDRITGDLRAMVVSKLVDACKGMFLLVHFYIEDLRQHRTTKEVRSALDSISLVLGTEHALNKTYSRLIDSIRAQHPSSVQLALKVLTWLLTASRTLDVDELRMAMAMGDGSRQGDPSPFNELEEMPSESSLVDVCHGLVMLDPNSHTIRFVHYSVYEYLEKSCSLGDLACANRHLTVTLGLLDHVWLSYIEPEPRRNCLQVSGGLISYARGNLHTHMQACNHIAPIETLLGFVRNTGLVTYLGDQRARMELDRCGFFLCSGRSAYGPFHVATEWGSTILINYLLNDEGAGIPSDVGTGTPLHVAAGGNLAGLVGFWLEKGIAVDTRGACSRGTPLSWAIRQGSIDAARMLLSGGADVITALRAPGWEGEEARDPNMLGLLFEFGLSLEHKREGMTYLEEAMTHNDSAVVELLLRKGVKIHARDQKGRTPLHTAVLLETTDIVRLLLQHGYGGHQEEQDEGEDEENEIEDRCAHCGDYGHRTPVGRLVDGRDCYGETPLHSAAERWNPDILRLLLSHGIDGTSSGNVRAPRVHEHAATINARSAEGHTALSYAASRFDEPRTVKVQMLVDAGADLTVLPYSYGSNTWLHGAGEMGNVALLKAALDAGVDPHTRGNDNKSPLHSAAYGASVDAVSLLMDRGLTVDLRDKQEKTPLHRARGAEAIALLLERGACTRSTDISGSSPLHSRLDSAYHYDRYNTDWTCEMIREDAELLIKGGADVNARNKRGETPLRLAARLGYAGLVSLLLESGADMGALDVNQMSALHHAATSKEVLGPHAISVLVEWGMSIDAVDIKQRTPLHHAVLAFSAAKNADLLVGKGASVDPRDSAGFTPLRRCIYLRAPWLARTLIQAGADVSTVYDGGVSLLHLAAQNSGKEVLALLLDAGADIQARDSKQRTPLHHSIPNAEDMDDGEKVIFLVERGAHINAKDINGNTPLQYVLDRDFYSGVPNHTMEALISLGADINVVGHSQKSLLHLAAQGDSRQLLALLLNAGADIHARDDNQQTPLHHALGRLLTKPHIIRYLADNGANVNARDINGQTPLHFVLGHRWLTQSMVDSAKVLLSFGADVNTVNGTHQNSLLHLAARGGSQEMLALLLDAGADIHARDSNERAVLHHVVLAHSSILASVIRRICGYVCKWSGAAEMLISLGADVNAIDKDQNSPLHLAAQEGEKNWELLVLLVHAGADRHARNCNQETPLDIAIDCGFSAHITDMLADRCAEHCPANQVRRGDPGAEMMEIDDASCAIEAPGQYPEEETTRKRRYSTAFPTRSN
ncbi:ankyrin repeat-containing domain protein [Morchella snyderi]|nr:ankyrin repeat-containing domain protein [Morchella snyderi]